MDAAPTTLTTTTDDTEPTEPPPKKKKRREKRMSSAASGQHHQLDFKELKDVKTLWAEYTVGINGGPALRDLELKDTSWRRMGGTAGRQRWSNSLPFYREIECRVKRGDREEDAVAAVQGMLDETPRKGKTSRCGPNFHALAKKLRDEQKARAPAASPAPEPARAPEELI